MDDKNQPKTAVWAVAFAIVTSIITYWQYEAKLVSPRPVFQGTQEASNIGNQKFPARLWQDPLLDVGTNIIDDITSLTEQIRSTRKQSGNSNEIEVMGVMIEGFPYPEDVEERLRIRYAVATSLFAQGYKLSDRSHLGLGTMRWPATAHILDQQPSGVAKAANILMAAFLRNYIALPNNCIQMFLPGSKETAAETGAEPRILIPFEWAEKEKGNKSVLVLWLQEEQFADYPLTRIARLMAKLELAKNLKNEFKFNLIGPRSSDTLKSMLTDPAFNGVTNHQARADHLELINHLHICSTSATAPDAKMFERTESPSFGNYRQSVANAFTTNLGENAFTNFIITDDLLALKMLKELKLRQIDLTDSNTTALVLVSESDTSYGRILPACFAATVAKQATNHEFLDLPRTNQHAQINYLLSESEKSWWPGNVKTFSYLRGLDGTPAKQNAEKDNTEPKKKEEDQNPKPARAPEDYERAQGEAQLDYVRRLADKIDKWQDEYFEYEHSYQPRLAIGVLGSDTYDKLILLEALRGKFKNAIFFATDLDARYLEKRQQEFCRNLLIVSAEQLEPLTTEDTHVITPFREGYQTAIFNACSHIVCGTNSWPSHDPHIFEVGLKNEVDLESPTKGWVDFASRRFFISGGLAIVGLLCMLSLLPKWTKAILSLPWPFSEFKRSGSSPDLLKFEDTYQNSVDNEWLCRHVKIDRLETRWVMCWAVLGMITSFACGWWFWHDNQHHQGEPFNWVNGISIWPTELMRIAIIFFGIICLVRAWYTFRRHKLTLWQHFFGPEGGIPATLEMDDLTDKGALALAKIINQAADPLSEFLKGHFEPADKNNLSNANRMSPADLKKILLRNINRIIIDHEIYEVHRVALNRLRKDAIWLLKLKPQGYQLIQLNKLILQDCYRSELRTWNGWAPEMPDTQGAPNSRIARFKQIVKSVQSLLCNLPAKIPASSINLWRVYLDFVDAQKSCQKYFQLGRLGPRCFRILLAIIAYSFFGAGLFLFWGWPIVPGRGSASFVWDHWILAFAVIVFVIVVFYVVDATRLTERFIHHLGDGTTVWPEHVQRKLAVDRNLDPAHLAGYLDVKFVAYHTQEIGRLFYFPFLMLTLLVAARNELFAPWTWPPPLLAINLTSALLVFLSAFHIRRSAQRVRKHAIESLQEFQFRLSGGEDAEYKWTIPLDDHGTKKTCVVSNYAEKIKDMIKELQEINTGAYAKVLRDDSVTAAMLPAVGAGLLVVIQKLFL